MTMERTQCVVGSHVARSRVEHAVEVRSPHDLRLVAVVAQAVPDDVDRAVPPG